MKILKIGVERKGIDTNNQWRLAFCFNIPKNTNLESVLVGIAGSNLKPIFSPRGLPKDISTRLFVIRKSIIKGTVVLGESYLELEEVRSLDDIDFNYPVIGEKFFRKVVEFHEKLRVMLRDSSAMIRIVFWQEVVREPLILLKSDKIH